MQIYPDKLQAALNRTLTSVYLVFGDEPYQKYQSIDQIRKAGLAQGFDERKTFVADKEFEWSSLIDATQTMSLFSAKQLIELELPTGKPGKEGSKTLLSIFDSLSTDTLLIIHGPKVGKDVQNTKWFKHAGSLGSFTPCYPLEGRALSQWLANLAQSKQCQLSADASSLLAEYCEGNMLAGAQEIEKLALNFPNKTIELTDIENAVVNQSRYNVFQLVDAFLAGDGKKTTKLLLALESEGLEPAIVIWALAKEWQTLTELKLTSGAINWNKFRIWGNRQSIYQSALSRLSIDDLKQLGDTLSYADSTFKSKVVMRPYVALSYLCLLFIHPGLNQLGWEA